MPKTKQPIWFDDSGDLPEFLYHGTSTLYLDRMFEGGLEPCNMTGEVLMCCLADDAGIAAHHAQCMAEFEGRTPVVFKIPVSKLNPNLFALEDNFVRIGPSVGRGNAVMDTVGEKAWMEAPWTWRAMLKVAGAVGYTGVIPVSRADLVPVNDVLAGRTEDPECITLPPMM